MKIKNIALTLSLIILSFCTLADDLDIYFSNSVADPSSPSLVPNVLFVIDTSDSMNDPAPGTRTDVYNPKYRYSPEPGGRFTTNQWFVELDKVADPSAYTITWKIACSAIQATVAANQIYEGPAEIDPSNGNVNCGTALSKNYRVANGNYLNWLKVGGPNSGDRYRLDIVKEEFEKLINKLSGVNIGLMTFDKGNPATLGKNGGSVLMEMKPVELARQAAINTVKDLKATSYTPISEAMTEASRYFKGLPPVYGAGIYNGIVTSKSVETSLDGYGNYKSPILSACQTNHIVLFTDGIPSADIDSVAEINADYQDMKSKDSSISDLVSDAPCNSAKDGACLDELTYYMKNADISPIDGHQYVTTHTIGGFMGSLQTKYLQDAALAGGGQFFNAKNATELASALTDIMDLIASENGTFTAPAVSASSSNRLTHDDSVFMAMFKPVNGVQWPGNLKKYKLINGDIYGKSESVTAVEPSSGMFKPGIFDLWNGDGIADGNKVEMGGASSVIKKPSVRNVYYDLESGAVEMAQNIDTTSSDNVFNTTPEKASKLKLWVRGYDVADSNKNGSTTDMRHPISDPLHSEPKIIKYLNGRSIVFFGDNEGYLHAVDAETGEEVYAFIPRSLLPMQSVIMGNSGGYKDRPYGLDGLISYSESYGRKYLYVGMRRGGRDYFALDITNGDYPQIKFVIKGGEGEFYKLGQSWAKAVPGKIKYLGADMNILVINGGYDPQSENSAAWEKDTMGNAIYIVNAETGERVWWASDSGADVNIDAMSNSIPSSATLVDINADGYVDYFYSADTGGHVFKVSIDNIAENNKNIASVSLIASLGGDVRNGGFSGEENNRKFYTSPSVSFWPSSTYGDFMSIAIGSGIREVPRSTAVQDNFYVLRDKFPYPKVQPKSSAGSTMARIYHQNIAFGDDDFINIGLKANQLDNPDYKYPAFATAKNELIDKLNSASGWYMPMDKVAGEKIVSDAVTFDGSVLFSSFSVKSVSTKTSCGVDLGRSQFYAIDLLTGSATIDLDGDGEITANDLKKDLVSGGLTPRPVVIFRENNKKTIVTGTETIEDTRYDDNHSNDDGQGPGAGDRSTSLISKMYWREKL